MAIASPATNLNQRDNRSLERTMAAARVADLNRGRDITILDLRELTPVFDYFIVVTGNSRRQLHAISEEIEDVLKKEFHDRRLGIEGFAESRWILLDFGDIVVHIFDAETRGYYDLERLWAGAKRVPFETSQPKIVPAVKSPAEGTAAGDAATDGGPASVRLADATLPETDSPDADPAD